MIDEKQILIDQIIKIAMKIFFGQKSPIFQLIKLQIFICILANQILCYYYCIMKVAPLQQQPSEQKMKEINENSNQKLQSLLELQGDIRIMEMKFIQIDWIKSILLILPVVLSLVGLLLLKYFKWFRVMVFFRETSQQNASFLFIKATQEIEAICIIKEQNQIKYFEFQKLRYQIIKQKGYPLGFYIHQYFQTIFSKQFIKKGNDSQFVKDQLSKYGRNQHLVDIPWYFQYMFDVMTKPFFLLQYVVCVILILQNYSLFAGVMFGGALLTTTINYILVYIGLRKLRNIAEKVQQVKVLRNGTIKQIPCNQLVPGDIFIPENELFCDAYVAKGQLYLNQASLTGQSVPVSKVAVNKASDLKENNRKLFEGTKVLETKPNTFAVVSNIGYATQRGRIIRRIMNRHVKDPDFFITALLFYIETFVIATLVYLATLGIRLSVDIPASYVLYKYFDFLGWACPPAIPIFFNLAYTCSVARLSWNDVILTEPQKSVQPGKIKTMCFDKTGTLTQNELQILSVFSINDKMNYQQIKQKQALQGSLMIKLFASCHTVRKINGEFMGDQVDLKMFKYSEFEIYQYSGAQDVYVSFLAIKGSQKLQIIRINQFQSKFMSMSVLVRSRKDGKIYAFLKGAPQKIQKNSIKKVKNFDQSIQRLSLRGYRTIAIGYKQIKQNQLQKYIEGSRQQYESKIIPLGLIAFQNKLKEDTKYMIDRLLQGQIQAKIITGDNIFIAVETGMRAGIVNRNEPVILLQGKNQAILVQETDNRKFKGTLLKRKGQQSIHQDIILQQKQSYRNQKYSIIVDGDFLSLSPTPEIVDNIKVFARISPQNKAKIIKTLKDQIIDQYNSRSRFQRIFGDVRQKVGMTGDGANDLIALREADVGIGISQSDASYASSFTIKNIRDVEYIIRQSKGTLQVIAQMYRYVVSSYYFRITTSILLIRDAAFFTNIQSIYYNFAGIILIPICLATSRPHQQMNPYSPVVNFLGLHNHLKMYGGVIFPTVTFLIGVLWYESTPEYQPNPQQTVTQSSGYNGTCHSVTAAFLLIIPPTVLNVFHEFIGTPWKLRIYQNYFMVAIISLNMIMVFIMHFVVQFGKMINLVEITVESSAILLGISIGMQIATFFYHQIIDFLDLYKKNARTGRTLYKRIRQQVNND